MSSDKSMKESNTKKAQTGNEFQNNFFEKVKAIVGDSAIVRNNSEYTIVARSLTSIVKTDVEVIFKDNMNTRFIFELTTSIRNDRFESKDAHAEGIINVLNKDGMECFYCLVLPTDDYYSGKNATKERDSNRHFADKINNQRNTTETDYNFIQIMFRESEALAFVKYLMTVDNVDIVDLVNKWKKMLNTPNCLNMLNF